MPKTLQLLLTENVENLGIVGDVVKVRSGFARNYLLPRELATEPSEEKVQALAARRADAERQLVELRKQREGMISKLDNYELTLQRACNDQGLLYGSVTQHDIALALRAAGFDVRDRDVRLGQTIKRIDSYEITVKPESDLEASIKLWVVADRKLESVDDREEMEFDAEGELVENQPEPAAEAEAEAKPTEA
ncbi:MAG: 50S ribosomal protein L9 [Phycisphaeraceae bacterium]|nr:MAG: 50S ribosomal protein L9 [Phycisphaeraceae bacterium]